LDQTNCGFWCDFGNCFAWSDCPGVSSRDQFEGLPERELRLTDLYARQAAELIEREQAKEALRKSQEKYRTLFDSIDEGFCTIEVLFDGNDKPIDYRFLEVNPSFEKQTGIQNARGRRMREIAPLHEEHWFEIYGKIALTGEPTRFENLAAQLHRWYDVYAFRIGEPQERKVAILFNDITERKRLERRVLEVSDIERRRIGQDLHDDLCQRLAAIQLMGDVLQRDLLAKAKPEAEQAGMIAARIRDAIANTRNIGRGLFPVALESNGLMVALQELAENSGKLFQISCEFRCDGGVAVDDNTSQRIYIVLLRRQSPTPLNMAIQRKSLSASWSRRTNAS
jgi:PAS domain S-box-containing protein